MEGYLLATVANQENLLALNQLHINISVCIYMYVLLADGDNGQAHPFGALSLGDQPHHMAQIGISVEPIAQVMQMTAAAKTAASTVDSFMEFSTKMLENFTNYAGSFAVTQSQMTPNPSETFVPFKTLQQWFANFTRRLQQDPYFWK